MLRRASQTYPNTATTTDFAFEAGEASTRARHRSGSQPVAVPSTASKFGALLGKTFRFPSSSSVAIQGSEDLFPMPAYSQASAPSSPRSNRTDQADRPFPRKGSIGNITSSKDHQFLNTPDVLGLQPSQHHSRDHSPVLGWGMNLERRRSRNLPEEWPSFGFEGPSTSEGHDYRSLGRRKSRVYSGEASGQRETQQLLAESELQEIQCLLPNGILLDVFVHPSDEIRHIKQVVLGRATSDERLPLRGCLDPDGNHYNVTFVSVDHSKIEICYDETKTLRELRPFQNLLKFSKKCKGEKHYRIKQHIGNLIGKDLKDFEDLRNCEVNDFRWRMKVFANRIAQERKIRLDSSLEAKIQYQYPPRLATHPRRGKSRVTEQIDVHLVWDKNVKLAVPAMETPREVVSNFALQLGYDHAYSQNFVIKVVGEDSFLVGDVKMVEFEYVHACIQAAKIPRLCVVDVNSIFLERTNDIAYKNMDNDVCSISKDLFAKTHSYTAKSLTSLGINPDLDAKSSWDLKSPFIITLENLTLSPTLSSYGVRVMGVQLGIFHGNKLLCPTMFVSINNSPDQEGAIPIQQSVQFDILVSNLPRMAKLCVGIFEKKKGSINPIFFVNTNIFDYKARLKWKATLHLWNYLAGDCMPTFQTLSPLRQAICNPNTKDAADLVICIHNELSDNPDTSIEYPDLSAMLLQMSSASQNPTSDTASRNMATLKKLYTQELRKIAERDPLHDLTVQEKDFVWKIRETCLHWLPELLPRIIDCVDYSNQGQVLELADLLQRWPILNFEEALQLLDYAYPDENVRKFAVQCLRQASDDEILRYLLQLAQTLKHESYFQCDLVEFLLERALTNQHIGHYLFWELKAEMNSPSVGLLFGLVLEAYLTAAPEHLKILEQQNALLEKCRSTQDSLRRMDMASKSREKVKGRFDQMLRQQFDGAHPYVNFVSPLDPGIRCRKIMVDRCKLMNSKMRPLWLAFKRYDSVLYGSKLEDVILMYKKGDDLRQDRLTLQLMKVMDLLWKDAGLDLRMSLYNCMSTDLSEGFIEVVQQAETICRIQMSQADFKAPTAVFRKGFLLNWIRSHNPTDESLLQAQYEFTQSCAAYSVATYVLGIGDRHNDNIMVKRNGQLFHIDFGHFLGNFKYKFGIKRERVPMILSTEFVEVIKADFGRKKNFERFRLLCEDAFLTIRRHGSLLISLLAMMISTGLPELSSEQDLNVVRSTLHLDRTEAAALDHFRKDFNESLRNAWSVSLNWWFHMMNQVRSKGGKG